MDESQHPPACHKMITSSPGPPPCATPNPAAQEVGKGETSAGRKKGVFKGGRGKSPRGEGRQEERSGWGLRHARSRLGSRKKEHKILRKATRDG